MRYLFLAYTTEGGWDNLSPADQQAEGQRLAAFVKEVEQRGIQELSVRPQPGRNAKTVRTQNGKLAIADGPYAETKEQIGRVYILNCKDCDEALEYARKLPAARFGIVEVRPLVES
jgi:hypothetical protein